MIGFSLLLALRANVTLWSDLVETLASRERWGIVSESLAVPRPILGRRRTDLVSLSNMAGKRWFLRVDRKRPLASATALPWERLYDPSILFERTSGARSFGAEDWNVPGGRFASVEEIFRAEHLDLKRCHWFLLRRRVTARFRAVDTEAMLPDLATAIGGVYDREACRIDFDPGRFREQLMETYRATQDSMPEFAAGRLGLAYLAVQDASDEQLRQWYARPGAIVKVQLTDRPGSRTFISNYISGVLADVRTSDPEGRFEYELRHRVDLDALPIVRLCPTSVALFFMSRDGKKGYVF